MKTAMKKKKDFDFGRMVNGCNLAFGAKVKVKGICRAFTLTYPLSNPIS